MKNKGYIQIFTGVSDPQTNGRAENAVQQVKESHEEIAGRLLHQAGWSQDQWPLAARHCDEQLRMARLGLKLPPDDGPGEIHHSLLGEPWKEIKRKRETGTSEDVLKTRIVGLGEVMKDLEPIEEELKSLIEDKLALEAIPKEEVERMFRAAHAQGRKLEVVPGKLVTVVKPAPEGGKKKNQNSGLRKLHRKRCPG
eukprot:s1049_g22.t1